MYFSMKLVSCVLLFGGFVTADCATSAQEVDGNWYCSAVKKITYNNFGTSGQYNQVIDMADDGTCTSVPKAFSGPLSPLNEQVSLHFRGPIALKQFASYTLSTKKRGLSEKVLHGHGRYHAHDVRAEGDASSSSPNDQAKALKKREDWVTATINGQVVSWISDYFGPTTNVDSVMASTAIHQVTTTMVTKIVTSNACPKQGTSTEDGKFAATNIAIPIAKSSTVIESATPFPVVADHAYTRNGYYNSASQSLDGLTFIGNYGGEKSGVFDMNYGNSLAYLDSAGISGAESAMILADMIIPSATEFAIFTDKACTSATCGYVRNGTVAYEGFDGGDKIFLFEFSMPSDGTTGFEADMPAIWMLNAEIPRTLQYGKAECSCWSSGCGEFDIVEVLSSGSMYCKSTVHTNTPGGDSNFIRRPTSTTMKLAVIFNSTSADATIQVLSDNVNFDLGLTKDQVAAWTSSNVPTMISVFDIVS